MFIIVLQHLFLEAFLDVFYFPLWWYTGGVKHAAVWSANLFKRGNRRLAPGLWLRNIFIPMYGQYDAWGKIISFFMRAVQVALRSFLLFVWLLVCLALFTGWLMIPFLIIAGIIFSLGKK